MQRFELDRRVLERGDEVERPLLVPEKQILGMAARNGPAQRLRLLDGEQRRMRHRAMRDAEAVEEGEEIGGRGGHGVISVSSLSFLQFAVTLCRGSIPWRPDIEPLIDRREHLIEAR